MPHFPKRSPVIVEPITSTGELESIARQWQNLWRQDRRATPFQSPAWLIPWWHNIGQGELLTLTIRSRQRIDGEFRLVGLLPMYIYTQPETGSRDILPLGVSTSDYLDSLFAPGWESCSVAAALEHLTSNSPPWDLLDFRQLRSTSACLWASVPECCAEQVAEDEPCPALALPATFDEFQAAASPHLLHNLDYYRKRATRDGELRFECATRDNLDEFFDALVELHQARWRPRGEDGCLADPMVRAAHRQSLPALLDRQTLRFYAMRLDGKIIGALYGLVDPPDRGERRFYYYLGGFDPDFDRISPGTLLVAYAIEQAIGDQLRIFDFLRGREPYKYLWGARDASTWRRMLRRIDAHAGTTLPQFEISLPCMIRPCRTDDLPTLEWFGLFASQRGLIQRQFQRHLRGETVMLVAEVNGVASGQAWVDFVRQADGSTGYIWAVRVFPALQRKRIGSRLIAAAEDILRERRFQAVELSVRKQNDGALRLYQRLGYCIVGETCADRRRQNSRPIPTCESGDQWILRKPLIAPRPMPRSVPAYPGQEAPNERSQPEDCHPLDTGRRERSRI